MPRKASRAWSAAGVWTALTASANAPSMISGRSRWVSTVLSTAWSASVMRIARPLPQIAEPFCSCTRKHASCWTTARRRAPP
jgi:hypothetical protein